MEEIAYMVCMRVDELDDPVEDSTTTACVECGSDVWISRASRKQMGKLKAMPVCSTCAKRIAAEQDEPIQLGEHSAEQFAEVERKIRKIAEETDHPEWVKILDDEDMDAFETLKQTAAMSGSVMEGPNDDWGSLVIMEDYEGHTLPPIPLSKMLMSGIPKELIAKQLLPALVQAAQAKRVIFGISAWSLDGKFADAVSGSLADHPDSKESLVLIDITADGVQQMTTAEITRDGISPPTLGAWRDSERPDKSDGMFVDALVPTLQLVRTLREMS